MRRFIIVLFTLSVLIGSIGCQHVKHASLRFGKDLFVVATSPVHIPVAAVNESYLALEDEEYNAVWLFPLLVLPNLVKHTLVTGVYAIDTVFYPFNLPFGKKPINLYTVDNFPYTQLPLIDWNQHLKHAALRFGKDLFVVASSPVHIPVAAVNDSYVVFEDDQYHDEWLFPLLVLFNLGKHAGVAGVHAIDTVFYPFNLPLGRKPMKLYTIDGFPYTQSPLIDWTFYHPIEAGDEIMSNITFDHPDVNDIKIEDKQAPPTSVERTDFFDP